MRQRGQQGHLDVGRDNAMELVKPTLHILDGLRCLTGPLDVGGNDVTHLNASMLYSIESLLRITQQSRMTFQFQRH